MQLLALTPEQLSGIGSGRKVGVLTSGGDAPGMNAALRAVARAAIFAGAEPYAIAEGFQGLVLGGDAITPMKWEDVSGILNRGGTVIGTYRSTDFRERAGRLRATENLVQRGIDRLIVIGGDGSLSGLSEFAAEWPDLISSLVDEGTISPADASAHPRLIGAGLIGSIDNDLVGPDMTIGADSALHRIQDAVDAIASTAASHQRCFVIETMGRHCGYLAVASAISGGCDYVLIPELPPEAGWEDAMCEQLRAARAAGRKDSIVILSEGTITRDGQPISAEYVRSAIEKGLGEAARVTILGHVQRGGTPSAFDRWAATCLGYTAVCHVLSASAEEPLPIFGFAGDQIVSFPLQETVANTHHLATAVAQGDYLEAISMRGEQFRDYLRIFNDLSAPNRVAPGPEARRIGIMHAGALAPGMNTAVKTAVQLGVSHGFVMVGIHNGFPGLVQGRMDGLTWREVDGWNQEGGAVLGTRRHYPEIEELYAISRSLEENEIDALLVIGGWDAYRGVQILREERSRYPALQIPIVCVPASIDNNLPATSMSVGADTALNVIVDCIDKVKMAASASRRCFVIETMGRACGYLAQMGGLAGGAERVYLNEESISLDQLQQDIAWVNHSFDEHGRNLFLAVRNEWANENFTTEVLAKLFDEEGQGRFDTRTMIIGHIQQGGAPTPLDRLLATRLTEGALTKVATELAAGGKAICCVGSGSAGLVVTDLESAMNLTIPKYQRPAEQWWTPLGDLSSCINAEGW